MALSPQKKMELVAIVATGYLACPDTDQYPIDTVLSALNIVEYIEALTPLDEESRNREVHRIKYGHR